MNSHSLSGVRIGDYCDGELFLKSELFKNHPCALQIQLYYDEIEVCNPIGSKAKIHKLGKVLFQTCLVSIDYVNYPILCRTSVLHAWQSPSET